MVDVTQNLVLDGSTDGDLLGNAFTWSGFPPFIAGYADDDGTAGTTTVNLSAVGDWFAYGIELNVSDLQTMVSSFTDAADGFTRYVGQLRLFEGTHTVNLTNTGIETLMGFRDADYDLTLGVYSHLVRLRTSDTNTADITIGDGGAGTIEMEAGTNTITAGSGNINLIQAGKYGETGTNTFVGGAGRVSFMELSGTSHNVTVGAGDLRDLKINDDGTDAVITATMGGEIDVLRSYVATTFTSTGYVGSVELGSDDDVLTLSGGGNQVKLGQGTNTLTITANTVQSVLASSGLDTLDVSGAGRVFTAHLGQGENIFNFANTGRAQTLGAWDQADTLNVADDAQIAVADLNSGDNVINQSGGWIGLVAMGNGDDEINVTGGRLKSVDADGGRNVVNVSGDGEIISYLGDEGVDIINITDTGRMRFINAGDGDNRIATGAEYTAAIEAYDGDDWVRTDDGFVRSINTSDGDDKVIVGAGGAAAVATGFGSDTVETGAGYVDNITTSNGSSQADLRDYVTIGTGGAGRIWTGDDDDRLSAYNGNIDVANTGSGNDKVFMGDVFIGLMTLGNGNDYVRVNQSTADGAARISGGGNVDTLDFRSTTAAINVSLDLAGQFQNIGNVADTQDFTVASLGFFAITSTERLVGTAFDDVLEGNDDTNGSDGANRLTGLGGNDTLIGLGGDDNLAGGSGNDMIIGGRGNDYIVGNRDNDTLNGGDGNDSLFGSTGADVFQFDDSADMGFDRVRDWANGTDQLDLVDFGFATFADVQAIAVDAGSAMRINLSAGNVIYIENFQLAQFDATDVILA